MKMCRAKRPPNPADACTRISEMDRSKCFNVLQYPFDLPLHFSIHVPSIKYTVRTPHQLIEMAASTRGPSPTFPGKYRSNVSAYFGAYMAFGHHHSRLTHTRFHFHPQLPQTHTHSHAPPTARFAPRPWSSCSTSARRPSKSTLSNTVPAEAPQTPPISVPSSSGHRSHVQWD
jgi:hypothetical protein